MKKRSILTVVLVVALVSGLLAAGCAKPAPAPAPSPAPTGEITVPPGETYEWQMFAMVPAEATAYNAFLKNKYFPDIERITNGRLKIDYLAPGEHPYKMADLLPALSEEKCQMIEVNYAGFSYVDPRFGTEDLPFLQPTGGHSVKKDVHRLLAPLYEPLYDEWGVFELAVSWNPPQNYWHVSKWLENMDSMKGEKIRTFGPEMDDFVNMMGGIPVRIDAAEAYTALQTGLISGLITGVPFAVRIKLVEVVKCYQPLEVFESTHLVMVNKNAWNKLPPEIRDVVLQYSDLVSGVFADVDVWEEAPRLQEGIDKYGLKVKPVPPGLRDQIIANAYEGIWKIWATRSGGGTAEFLDLAAKRIQAAGYEIPGYPSR